MLAFNSVTPAHAHRDTMVSADAERVCACEGRTVSAQRSGEGEGVGDVVGGDLLLDQRHQRTVGDLAGTHTQTHTDTESHQWISQSAG